MLTTLNLLGKHFREVEGYVIMALGKLSRAHTSYCNI